MTASEDRPKAEEIMTACTFTCLTTCDSGQPRARPVSVFPCGGFSFAWQGA